MSKLEKCLRTHGYEPRWNQYAGIPKIANPDDPRIIYLGADCEDGWVPLIDELITDLKAMGWDGKIHQLKEKFGGLRFYIGGGSDAIFDRISKAEAKSYEICERCGNPGKPRKLGWIKTLCDEHAKGAEVWETK